MNIVSFVKMAAFSFTHDYHYFSSKITKAPREAFSKGIWHNLHSNKKVCAKKETVLTAFRTSHCRATHLVRGARHASGIEECFSFFRVVII